ncbi:MAG: hypothetical protein HZB91_02485 [Elusimicrobia bacterium]|nr:hypothetical protein [Elusimicrobiota bacterium]
MAASQGRPRKALAFYDRISKPDLKGDVLAGVTSAKTRLHRSLGRPALP